VPRKTAENTVKHRGGGVGSVVANHRGGGEISMVVTTLIAARCKKTGYLIKTVFVSESILTHLKGL